MLFTLKLWKLPLNWKKSCNSVLTWKCHCLSKWYMKNVNIKLHLSYTVLNSSQQEAQIHPLLALCLELLSPLSQWQALWCSSDASPSKQSPFSINVSFAIIPGLIEMNGFVFQEREVKTALNHGNRMSKTTSDWPKQRCFCFFSVSMLLLHHFCIYNGVYYLSIYYTLHIKQHNVPYFAFCCLLYIILCLTFCT